MVYVGLVGEEVEVYGVIVVVVVVCVIDEVLVVVGDMGEVFEGDLVWFWLCENVRVFLFVWGW